MSSNSSSTKPANKDNVTLHNLRNPDRERVYSDGDPYPSLTKQEFALDCDINHIMAKYQKTGAISHFAKYSAEYGDFSPCDLQEALATVQRAQKMYDDLPSSIRRETQSPEGFLAFVQDPANRSRLEELGLANTPAAPIVPPPATPV